MSRCSLHFDAVPAPPETDPIRAFAFGFCHIERGRAPCDFVSGDRLYEKWRATGDKALELARAAFRTVPAADLPSHVARQICAWAMSSDPLWQGVPDEADLPSWIAARWLPATKAMLEAARAARAEKVAA